MNRPVARADIVQAAAEVATLAAETADQVESARRLPDPIVQALGATGLYHLYLPASAGGPEADPLSALLAMETLGRADGSVAWCAQVSSANSWQLATLDPAVVEVMLAGEDRTGGFSGSARPLGRAMPVEGGYVASGRWDFASNCLHADWYCGTCVVEGEGDRPRSRAMFFPMTDVEVIDTWHVAGLRGTGSHDVAVHEVFVPAERVSAGRHLAGQPGPLYRQRLTMVVNWAPTAGMALGVAQGAIDAFVALSGQATSNRTEIPLRDRSEVQATVGRASATLGAARAYCLDAIAAAWEADLTADPCPELDRVVLAARLAITHALHAAVEVVNQLFAAGGTRSIFDDQGLERRFRDAHVAVQHGAGSPGHFLAGGRVALGLPAGAPFW